MKNQKLAGLYYKAINLMYFKSNILDKNNDLRQLLDLPLRNESLEKGYYDKQVVDALHAVDFSSLDYICLPFVHNTTKNLVLAWGEVMYCPDNKFNELEILGSDLIH